MTTKPDVTAFDEVVAAWERHIPCREETRSGAACKRPARWLVILHDCDRLTMCTQHYNWRAASNEAICAQSPHGSHCPFCKRVYMTFADAHTAVRL